jgi:hypothetical protein
LVIHAILALFVKNKEILEMICDARNETWGENIHISKVAVVRDSHKLFLSLTGEFE